MIKTCYLLPIISVVLGCNVAILSPVRAEENNIETTVVESQNNQQLWEQMRQYNRKPRSLKQFNSVDQLRDVSPGDWAYEALRNLVETYGCIAGFPDGTFRGNRSLNRYEFAAGLNACLQQIERLIANPSSDEVTRENLAVLQKLTAEFEGQLSSVLASTDKLEGRVDFLTENQFSTTTVLRGDAILNAISAFGSEGAVGSDEEQTEDIDSNVTFSGRARFDFDSSFTGRDRLRVRFEAGNISNFGRSFTGTDMTRISSATNTNNNFRISSLFYEIPLGDRGLLSIAPLAEFPTRIIPSLNPVSSISLFASESPVYGFAFGTGTGIYYQFNDAIAAGLHYLAGSASDPGLGLFNGQYSTLAQFTFTPSDSLGVSLTYAHYYSPEPGDTINVTGSQGSLFAQVPFGENTATSANAFGLQFSYRFSDRLLLGGWANYTNAIAESSPRDNGFDASRGADADIWGWAVTAALPDLGGLGNQLNFIFGQPPKLTNNDVPNRSDDDSAFHIELSYRYRIDDRIFLTPGVLVITSPEHNDENDAIWLGILRTVFLL
ncbi:MAG: iron uptake porin [Symploca sp. SIO2E9]|nr:iron uptake porin [Symploca sp. SIO2E9]